MPQYKTLYPYFSKKVKRLFFLIMLFCVVNISFPQMALASAQIDQPVNQQETLPEELLPNQNETLSVSEEAIYRLPEIKNKEPRQVINLTVTAYSSTPDQTSGDPFITASGERVRDGIIAYNYLPLGTYVRFPEDFGDKVFVVKDRLPKGASVYLADIWMPTREEALNWGAKILRMEVL